MSTNFHSKSFRQTAVNDKVVDRSGYNIAYDGENAVIDALKNDELYRVEIDRDEFFNLMKQFYKSNRSGSRSIRDTLMNDFDIDKSGLVGDLFRDKEYSRSLISSMFSDDDNASYRDYNKETGVGVTKKRKLRRGKGKLRDTAKKRPRRKKQ